MSTHEENDNGDVNNGTTHGGCERIGLGLAGATAIILLFILSGSSQAQPRATIRPSSTAVPLNEQLHIALEVEWTGDVDAYDIPQPDVSMLSEFRVVRSSLSAERKNGRNVLKHDIVLQPLKEGEYDMGRIRLEYFEKNRDVPVQIPLPKTMVTVVPPRLIPDKAVTAAAVGALIVAVVGVTIILVRRDGTRKRKRSGAAPEARRTRDELLAELNEAISLRIAGETGAYLDGLYALAGAPEVEPHIGALDQLRELTEGVKFGGLILSPDQQEWAEKKVKNAIRLAFPIEQNEEE